MLFALSSGMSKVCIYNGEMTKRRHIILIAVCVLLVRETIFEDMY